MTDDAQHDPLPYILDGLDITTPEDSGFAIIACVNPDTKDGGTSRGQFIVRACNSHYTLLNALKGCLEALQSGMSGEERAAVFGDGYGIYQLMEEAEKAIAKAETAHPEPTCADRAAWAESAVTAYAQAKEGHARAYDPLADMASDLFTDRCHLFLREGVSPEQMMDRARTHYQEERAEEGREI